MRTLALGLLASLGATSAHAGPLAGLKDLCGGGMIENRAIGLELLNKAGIKFTPEVIDAYSSGALGDLAVRKLPDAKWNQVLNAADTLVTDGPSMSEGGLIAKLRMDAPPHDRGAALLNGPAPWFAISCAAATPSAGSPEPGRRAAEKDEGKDAFRNLIVARSIDDADKGAAKREFATVSYTADAKNDEEIISAEIFIGLPGVLTGIGPNHSFRPYLAYQRQTGEKNPINDLTFGLSSRWWLRGPSLLQGKSGAGNAFFLSGEYETDDEFRADVFRGELAWEPIWLDLCGHLTTDRAGFSCTPKLFVDAIEVQDAGDKKTLKDAKSFQRYGASFDFAYRLQLKGKGLLKAYAGYALREPFGGGVGDAARARAGLQYSPPGASYLSLGLEYVNGEDVTSLVRQETVKFAVGFKLGN